MRREISGVSAAPRTAPAGIRILVADDDPAMLELTASMLSRLGYDVVTASDGETALRVFQQSSHPIELVISDGHMPGLGGLQLLRAISQISPSTATLLISGSAGVLFAAGTAALAKPFRPEALAAKVEWLLASRLSNSNDESQAREPSLGSQAIVSRNG